MRARGIPDAYERLKKFTRGRAIGKDAMREFIASSDLPPADKERLLRMEPKDYVGLAPILAKRTRGP
jgi:adenylosuccinate lyase